jgi:hypothetical protein
MRLGNVHHTRHRGQSTEEHQREDHESLHLTHLPLSLLTRATRHCPGAHGIELGQEGARWRVNQSSNVAGMHYGWVRLGQLLGQSRPRDELGLGMFATVRFLLCARGDLNSHGLPPLDPKSEPPRHTFRLLRLSPPLTTRLKSRTSAASSLGSEPCVFTRRRNSSWSRSIVF